MSLFYQFKNNYRNSKKYTILHLKVRGIAIEAQPSYFIYLKPTKKTTFIVKALDSGDSFISPLNIDKKESKFSLIRKVFKIGFLVVGFFVVEKYSGYSKAYAMPIPIVTSADGSPPREIDTNTDGSLLSPSVNNVVKDYLAALSAKRSKSKLPYARRFSLFLKDTLCMSPNQERAVLKEIMDEGPRRSTNSTAVSCETQDLVATNCRMLDGKVVSATDFDTKVAKLTTESATKKLLPAASLPFRAASLKTSKRNLVDILFIDHSEVKLNVRYNGRAIIRKTFKGLKNKNPAQNNLNSEDCENYGFFFSVGPDRSVYDRVSFNMNVSDVNSAKSLKTHLKKLAKKQQTYKFDDFELDHLVQNDIWPVLYPGKLPRSGQGDSSMSLLCSSSANSAFNKTQIGFSDALKGVFLKPRVHGELWLSMFHTENKFSLEEIIHKICYDTIISR